MEVRKYCIEDFLQKDYYDAVFEAAKGLAERVRQITGLTTDGGTSLNYQGVMTDLLSARSMLKR